MDIYGRKFSRAYLSIQFCGISEKKLNLTQNTKAHSSQCNPNIKLIKFRGNKPETMYVSECQIDAIKYKLKVIWIENQQISSSVSDNFCPVFINKNIFFCGFGSISNCRDGQSARGCF